MSAVSKVFGGLSSAVRSTMSRTGAHLNEANARAAAASAEQNSAQISRSAADLFVAIKNFIPQGMQMAKTELSAAMANPNPMNWTVGGAMAGTGVAIELFGCFCIGEIIAKRQIIGYPIKTAPAAHH